MSRKAEMANMLDPAADAMLASQLRRGKANQGRLVDWKDSAQDPAGALSRDLAKVDTKGT